MYINISYVPYHNMAQIKEEGEGEEEGDRDEDEKASDM